jgi:hypothetical protein
LRKNQSKRGTVQDGSKERCKVLPFPQRLTDDGLSTRNPCSNAGVLTKIIFMKYEVAIVRREQLNYIVDADTKEEAEDKAKQRYYKAEKPDILGNEWDEIESVKAEVI